MKFHHFDWTAVLYEEWMSVVSPLYLANQIPSRYNRYMAQQLLIRGTRQSPQIGRLSIFASYWNCENAFFSTCFQDFNFHVKQRRARGLPSCGNESLTITDYILLSGYGTIHTGRRLMAAQSWRRRRRLAWLHMGGDAKFGRGFNFTYWELRGFNCWASQWSILRHKSERLAINPQTFDCYLNV